MGKRIACYEACSIALVACGLSSVGVAAMLKGSDGNNDSLVSFQILGMIFVLATQAFLAVSSVIEERLLQGCGAPAEFVCGMVGAWGMLFTCVIFIPIAQFLLGADGSGVHEDSINTLYMIKNSTSLQLLLCAYLVVILGFNLAMRILNKISQATTIQFLSGLRTLCVWVVALLMYLQWPQYGEKWVWSTWIEFGGFMMLITGVFMYMATFKFPCFKYAVTAVETQPPEIVCDNTSQISQGGTSLIQK